MIHKQASASDFIASDKPVDLLGTVHVLTFEGKEGDALRQHEATDEEVNKTPNLSLSCLTRYSEDGYGENLETSC